MLLNDLAIGLLGLSALYLLQNGRKRMGCALGLCAQPFWLYSTYQASQWGIFFLCLLYTAMYVKGVIDDRKLD